MAKSTVSHFTHSILFLDLQVLQWWTEAFLVAVTQSIKKMPYGIRFLAREMLHALQVRAFLCCNSTRSTKSYCAQSKFPKATEDTCATCIGRLVYYRYINPAIM